MTGCKGELADEVAEAYLQGSLPESETEQFEDHYFDCVPCFARVQALQSVQQELASRPVAASISRERWRRRMLALATIAAVFLMGGIAVRNLRGRHQQQSAAKIEKIPPAISQQAPSVPAQVNPVAPMSRDTVSATDQFKAELMQLADLSLPPFVETSPHPADAEDQFSEGMRAYAGGDCAMAIPSLNSVSSTDRNATAAKFYIAACELFLQRIDRAIADLKKVIQLGDSPQLEAANYLLAQAMLKQGDAPDAQSYLEHTLLLHGEYEGRAREQLRRLKK